MYFISCILIMQGFFKKALKSVRRVFIWLFVFVI